MLSFEELDFSFVFDGGFARIEGAEVTSFACLGVLFPRVEPVLPGW
jgi:hypothetical protein